MLSLRHDLPVVLVVYELRPPVLLLHGVIGGRVVSGGRNCCVDVLMLGLRRTVNADGCCGPFDQWLSRNGTSSWSFAAQQGSRLDIKIQDSRYQDSRFKTPVSIARCMLPWYKLSGIAWYHVGVLYGHGSLVVDALSTPLVRLLYLSLSLGTIIVVRTSASSAKERQSTSVGMSALQQLAGGRYDTTLPHEA